MTSVYEQHPIRDGGIRVVILHPSAQAGDPLECDLEVQIPDEKEYEALSYTWGPPYHEQPSPEPSDFHYGGYPDPDFKYEAYQSPNRYISLCGQTKQVTGNLFDALKRFRQRDRTRRIWIDALCINQEDDLERSKQVAMMANIYHSASMVWAWLGEDSAWCEASTVLPFYRALVDAEHELGSFIQDLEAKADNSLVYRFQPDEVAQRDDRFRRLCVSNDPRSPLFKDEVDHKAASDWFRQHTPQKWNRFGGQEGSPLTVFVCTSLFFFLKRAYFGRRWVLQELHQAQHAVVCCGEFEMDWTDFRSAHLSATLLMRSMAAERDLNVMGNSPLFADSLQSTSQTDPVVALYERMRACSKAECHDPRDVVYALLSFDDPPAMLPDYTLSPRQLWIELYRALIARGHLTRLILKAADQVDSPFPRDTQSPSWLSDFSITYPWHYFAFDYAYIENEPSGDVEARIDDKERLSCPLRCLGEVVFHNGWAVLGPEVSQDVLK